METYQKSSISDNIRHVYKRRLLPPLLYLMILAALWVAGPVSDVIFPPHVSSPVSIRELHSGRFTYVSTTLTGLHFTGYTQKFLGFTNGYYYYTFQGGQCILVLLAPDSCEEGLPDIEKITVRVRIIRNFDEYDTLTANLARDLNWTASGIRSQIPDYLLSEPEFNKLASLLLLGFFLLSGIYALLHILTYAAYVFFPLLSPACRHLGRYGNARELFARAEEELATVPQLAAEDMYITEHFFIVFADDQTAIVPIDEIIWVYKHPALHRFLWYYFNISYTLHITARKHLYLQCPKNMKSDIDGIIDYLCEANHKILAGFSEENRQQVLKLLWTSKFSKKLVSFFSRISGRHE